MALTELLLSLAAQAGDFSSSSQGHGSATAGPLDLAITAVGAVIVLLVIVFATWYFLRPREKDSEHIKRRILREEARGSDVI